MMATGLLCRQHRRIEQLLHALKTDGYRRNRVLLELMGELTNHLAVEANLLHPAARRALGEGLRNEAALHRRARAALYELTASSLTGEAFARKVDELSTLFAQHVALEEQQLFPALARTLDPAVLEELGEDMEALSVALSARSRPYVRGRSDERAA